MRVHESFAVPYHARLAAWVLPLRSSALVHESPVLSTYIERLFRSAIYIHVQPDPAVNSSRQGRDNETEISSQAKP